MSNYFTKTDDKYFGKHSTELKSKEKIADTIKDLAGEFSRDLKEKATSYRKVTSRVVTKRYAVRKD